MTGVQTCALPISLEKKEFERRTGQKLRQLEISLKDSADTAGLPARDSEKMLLKQVVESLSLIHIFRIFRGTLKYNTLIATLQLVEKLCNVAVSLSEERLQALSWSCLLYTSRCV